MKITLRLFFAVAVFAAIAASPNAHADYEICPKDLYVNGVISDNYDTQSWQDKCGPNYKACVRASQTETPICYQLKKNSCDQVIADLQKKITDLTNAKNKAQSDIKTLAGQLSTLKSELSKLQSAQRAQNSVNYSALRDQIGTLTRQKSSLENDKNIAIKMRDFNKVSIINNKLNQVNNQLSQMNAVMDNMTTDYQDMIYIKNTVIKQTQEQIDTLGAQVDSINKQLAALKDQLTKAQNGQCPPTQANSPMIGLPATGAAPRIPGM